MLKLTRTCKAQNNIEFIPFNLKELQNTASLRNRNLIILICSLITYWSGEIKMEMRNKLKKWMPTSLDMIPLRVLLPLQALT
jgi:hypothetical protein